MKKIKIGKKAIHQKTAVSKSKPILKVITEIAKIETSATLDGLLTT